MTLRCSGCRDNRHQDCVLGTDCECHCVTAEMLWQKEAIQQRIHWYNKGIAAARYGLTDTIEMLESLTEPGTRERAILDFLKEDTE